MLDQVNKNIQRYVDSGDYFKDAKEWYASKFLLPFSLRSYALLFFIVILFATYIMIELMKVDSAVKNMPFPMYAYDSVNYFPHIKPLTEVKEPINNSVARYMASKYVIFRESYNFNDTQGENKEISEKRIQALSSRRMYKEFIDYMNPDENPDSPLIRYKSQVKRVIEVKSVELFGQYDLPERASVTFEAIEKSKNGIDSTTTWQADIDFTMLDLEKKDENGQSKLSFTVTNYTTNKL
jgi:type IV secretory pathway component VirB8